MEENKKKMCIPLQMLSPAVLPSDSADPEAGAGESRAAVSVAKRDLVPDAPSASHLDAQGVWMGVVVCGWVWSCVDGCGRVWMCVDMCGCVWICVDVCYCVWMYDLQKVAADNSMVFTSGVKIVVFVLLLPTGHTLMLHTGQEYMKTSLLSAQPDMATTLLQRVMDHGLAQVPPSHFNTMVCNTGSMVPTLCCHLC